MRIRRGDGPLRLIDAMWIGRRKADPKACDRSVRFWTALLRDMTTPFADATAEKIAGASLNVLLLSLFFGK